jgi:putative redox protein
MPTTVIATIDPARSRVEARARHAQPISMDIDAPYGDDSAPGPKETLLAALAGCTAMDVASILRKKRQSAATYEVAVSAESAESHPKVFTAIRVEHRVTGEVEAEPLRRSVELSSTRYCPVSAMLSKSTTIEHSYRLIGADGVEHAALVAITGPAGARVL